jgi:hypothetical protein
MKRSIYTYVLSYCMAIIIHWYWYTFAFACITTQVLRTVAAVGQPDTTYHPMHGTESSQVGR